MRNEVLIGIDAGTTVFKAAAFDARTGRVLALATRRLPVKSPRPGWRETPAPALDTALKSTFAELRRTLGSRWQMVAGIGVAAQGGSAIFAHSDSGDAETPMILWNDERASADASNVRAMKRESWWQARLLNAWTPAGLPRLRWFARNCPQRFGDSKFIHVGAGEYLYHRLTSVWRQDSGNAIQIGSYDAAKGQLSNDMLKLVDFSKARVAPMRVGNTGSPVSPCASRRHALPGEAVVAGPYIDQEAALYAVRDSAAKPLLCSLGTAWVGNFSLPAQSLGQSSIQFVLQGNARDKRTIVLPLLSGNAVWDWFLSNFVHRNTSKALAMADATLADSLFPPPGIICVPHLVPLHTRHATAIFGFGKAASMEDSLRAIVCGMCCELYRVFAELKTTGAVDSLILTGGASKSAHFRALIATLFAPLPVFVLRDQDTSGARGALAGFGGAMAGSPVSRVWPLRGKSAATVASVYEDYLQAFEEAGDDFARSVAYTFSREHS